MAFTAPPIWDLIMMILTVVVVIGALAGAALLGASLSMDARAQACEKVAVGEQSPELLPGIFIDCTA